MEYTGKSKQEKLNSHYPVKSCGNELQVKDVDTSKRTVRFVANTYYWLDSDMDILVDGAAKRSIDHRGPLSNAVAKIKHQADHSLSVDKMIGKPTLIEELKSEGKTELIFESKIPQTTAGNDHLIKYQEGLYDNHSIGFRYKDLAYASRDSSNEDKRNRFNKYIGTIINPEKALEYGWFWIIKEIELFEASTVSFGANSLTPFLGAKSDSKESMLLGLNNRLDALDLHLRNGKSSDDAMKDFELQVLQIKQIMSDIAHTEPSKKDTHLNESSDSDILNFAKMAGHINLH